MHQIDSTDYTNITDISRHVALAHHHQAFGVRYSFNICLNIQTVYSVDVYTTFSSRKHSSIFGQYTVHTIKRSELMVSDNLLCPS